MIWEFLRDIGLLVFVAGGFAFAVGRRFHRHLDLTNVALLATIGDAAMLVGACLAVTAMIIGYFVAGESP